MTYRNFLLSLWMINLALYLSGCGGSAGALGGVSSVAASSVALASSTSSIASNSTQSAATSSLNALSSKAATSTLIQYGSNKMQVGELRLPSSAPGQAVPVVIIIHGGCWVSSYADYHFMDKFARAVTALGYATWNIEYRALGTGGNWPVMFQDVAGAADYLVTLAANYPLDLNKVAAIGHSAGGHLALWLASRTRISADSNLYRPDPLPIRGVLSLAGIANVIGNNNCFPLTGDVIGMPVTPITETLQERLRNTSPLQMLPTQHKTVLVSGGADTIVPAAMGIEYSSKASELGDDSVHYILLGLGHFELIDPTKTDWALYQQSLEQIFRE